MKYWAAILFLSLWSAFTAGGQQRAEPVDFNREIRPILSDTCFFCHGPDEKHRQANLRLDTKEGAIESGVIVPGDANQSRLYFRLSIPNAAARMPPPNSGRSLKEEQIELIRRWIDEGAPWEEHWAFVPPKRPEPPAALDRSWGRNPIDRFILARLEREGLKPSPEADKATLLRRVSLDLTGLPPTPAEADAFQADRSRDAYERLVDRLLASPRYGERMAMEWLDLARYADTHGYHIDSHRDMWRWRDWVIGAFNRNLPFDRFTIEQLAGDLLPDPSIEQRIATGFNRNHMINFEGGAIPEEYLNEYVADRVETTSTVWMGLTMNCARCHDHKYDPISQKEFYQFYGFFHNVPEKGLDGRRGNAEPVLQLPSPEQRSRQQKLDWDLCEAEAAMEKADVATPQAEWEKTRAATLPPDPREGLLAHYELDGNLADTSGNYRHGRAARGEVAYLAGQVGRGAEFSGQTHVELGQLGGLEGESPFSLALWVRYGGVSQVAALQKRDGGAERRGFELGFSESTHIGDLRRGAYIYFDLVHRWPDEAIRIRTRNRVVQSDWHHVAITWDGSGRASGLKLFLNGEPHDFAVLRDNLTGSFGSSSPLEVGNMEKGPAYKGRIDDLRIYSRLLDPAEVETLALYHPIRAILSEAPNRRTRDQRNRLREFFLTYDAPDALRELHARIQALRLEKAELEKAIPTVMVMEEGEPRETFVLERGEYTNLGEKVSPAVPRALPPLPEGVPVNRLGLAKWLVDPSHPLTARVAVNRYWQLYFGTGLVKTVEDFGSQGEPPSHPELLDWLATEFIRSGWDIKAMQRLMVTSAAYRQSSRATPALLDKDPENRLLARGPRFRLPAEMVRDNALYASGLLNEEMGGPGVFPYQPEGIWEEIAYGDVYSAQSYTQSTGADLYRRTMYTFWKRTAPPPSLMAFDAPDREKCTARRPRTNTPLQALVLMNDPTYVEAARALAERMMREGGRNRERRISHGFRLATARQPVPEELAILEGVLRRKLADYRNDRESALALLGVGGSRFDSRLDPSELAAWTTVASMLLNLDETITKE